MTLATLKPLLIVVLAVLLGLVTLTLIAPSQLSGSAAAPQAVGGIGHILT